VRDRQVGEIRLGQVADRLVTELDGALVDVLDAVLLDQNTCGDSPFST